MFFICFIFVETNRIQKQTIMRKALLFTLIIFTSGVLSAQVYLGLGMGYALGAGKRVNGYEIQGNVVDNIYGSYGKGVVPNLKLGLMFNDHLGVELNASFLIGASQTKLDSDTSFIEAKATGLRLLPQLVYRIDGGLYGRIGFILPLLGQTVVTETTDLSPTMKLETEMQNKGSFSVGFAGAIGYIFSISDNMNLYIEAQYIGLAIRSGSAEYTEYKINGEDKLSTLSTGQREFEYYDKVDNSTDNTLLNPNWDKDEPTIQLRQNAPFSALEVNVGITFRI
jgi:hypothetical protein